MPLDLPPPVPPQLADTEVLEERYAAEDRENFVVLNIDGSRLFISGNSYMTAQRIREVTAPAKTPSQAILLLNALYRAEGHLFVNVQYGRKSDAKIIYVHVNEGYLAEVDAGNTIEPFFEHLEGQRGVTESEVEPQRILAEIKAERAGYSMSSRYVLDDSNPEAFTLVIEGRKDPDHNPAEFTGVFGNPGNRFLGRYFGAANVKFFTPNGDKIGLGYTRALTELGNPRGGDQYNRYNLAYTTATPYGIFGANTAYTEYEAAGALNIGTGDREEAEIVEGGLTANHFLYADSETRIVLEESLKYVDSTIEVTEGMAEIPTGNGNGDDGGGFLSDLIGGLLDPIFGNNNPDPPTGETTTIDLAGQTVQDESYAVGRLGTSISHTWRLFENRGSLNLGAGYKRGFAGEIQNGLVDPERTADFGLYEGNFQISYRLPADLIASFKFKGQHADGDRVPQQQQWVLGGPDNLSAFLPGLLIGDTGAYGRFQLQLPRWELFTRPYRFSLFVEGGTAKFEGPNPPIGREGRESATDAGIKLEFSPLDELTMEAYFADGLSTSDIPEQRAADADSDVYFSVKAEF